MGYLPLNKDRRQATMDRKRREYLDCVEQYFGAQNSEGNYANVDDAIFHQIQIDVPRTNPDVKLYLNPVTRKVSLSPALPSFSCRDGPHPPTIISP